MAYLFKEIGDEIPIVSYSLTSPTPPEGQQLVSDVVEFKNILLKGLLSSISDYRIWRDALKMYVIGLGGGSESDGFDALPTDDDRTFCAYHNIGTAVQRLLATPIDIDRDKACFDFICINEGIQYDSNGSVAIKNAGGAWAKGILFSRCAHININVPNVGTLNMPTYVFTKMQITATAPYELSGDLLAIYRNQGIDGLALGFPDIKPPLGISDYIQETDVPPYFVTRFAPANGGGMRTDPLLIDGVNEAISGITGIGISGFNGTASEQLNGLADFVLNIIKYGKPIY